MKIIASLYTTIDKEKEILALANLLEKINYLSEVNYGREGSIVLRIWERS